MTTGSVIYPDPGKAVLLTGPACSLGSPGQERCPSFHQPMMRMDAKIPQEALSPERPVTWFHTQAHQHMMCQKCNVAEMQLTLRQRQVEIMAAIRRGDRATVCSPGASELSLASDETYDAILVGAVPSCPVSTWSSTGMAPFPCYQPIKHRRMP